MNSVTSLAVLFSILLLASALTGCESDAPGQHENPETETKNPSQGVVLRVPTWRLVRKGWAGSTTVLGEITAHSPLSLQMVADAQPQWLLQAGETVIAGQALARTPDEGLIDRLAVAKSAYEKHRRNAGDALSRWRSQVSLDAGLLAREASHKAEQDILAVAPLLYRAEQDFVDAQLKAMHSELVAPSDGRLVSMLATASDDAGPAPATVNSAARKELLFEPANAVAAQVHWREDGFTPGDVIDLWPGQFCQVKALNTSGRIYDATVVATDKAALEGALPDHLASTGKEAVGTGTSAAVIRKATLLVDNSLGLLQRGMRLRARCEGFWREDMIDVPRTGLLPVEGVAGLYRGFVLDGDRAGARFVIAGTGDRNNLPVLLGLDAGEELIISKLDRLKDGQPVQKLEWLKVTVKDEF